MRTLRLGAAFLAAVALSAGCGGKHEAASHETVRTPAGIALKAGEPTAAPTPAPK